MKVFYRYELEGDVIMAIYPSPMLEKEGYVLANVQFKPQTEEEKYKAAQADQSMSFTQMLLSQNQNGASHS